MRITIYICDDCGCRIKGDVSFYRDLIQGWMIDGEWCTKCAKKKGREKKIWGIAYEDKETK